MRLFQDFKLVKVKMSSATKQETISKFISLYYQHLNHNLIKRKIGKQGKFIVSIPGLK